MKTSYSPNVKKLSKTIRLGKKIADEAGIKHGRGDWIKLNKAGTKIDCACALGMSLIGKHGVEKSIAIARDAEKSYTNPSPSKQVGKDFPGTGKTNYCLLKTPLVKRSRSIYKTYSPVESVVMALNDNGRKSIEEIVETLESCSL